MLLDAIKYKKEKDSDNLLKYGELFINYMEDPKKSNKIFNIYNKIDGATSY